MKKTLIYIIILAVLGAITWYLIENQKTGTSQKQLTNFAFEDTASITKIFLADKSNKSLTLKRTNNHVWTINEENVARKDMVDNLLKTIKLLKVRTPVPKSMHNNVIRHLAGNSVKVELYTSDENSPALTYFVGGPNKDHTGSYMLLENSSVPFVMHLEGHYGYLSSRYSTNKYVWRNNYIWQFPGKQITQIERIEITNHRNPSQSFSIKKVNDQAYEFYDANRTAKAINNGKLLNYVKQYQSVAFEGYEETKQKSYMDSVITNIKPWHTIKLTQSNGTVNTVKTWPKPMKEGANELLTGEKIENDMERLYAVIDNDKMVIGQHLTFGPLTVDANFFDN